MDRVLDLLANGAKKRSPDSNFMDLINVITPSVIIPETDKYYVFAYKAKTPNIQYDQYPFVYVTAVFQWGFTGYNFHWEASRQYSWAEVVSNLYEVTDEELNSVQALPIAKLVQS